MKVFTKFDAINLPNPKENKGASDVVKENFNVFEFIFEDPFLVSNKEPFYYYRYFGSHTQPPCAEHVMWVVVDENKKLGSTIIAMFRDALMDPTSTSSALKINNGNNRIL